MARVRIFVKTWTGKLFSMEVAESDAIDNVKATIARRGVPLCQQRLLHAGMQLEIGCTLSDYNIVNGTTVCLESTDLDGLLALVGDPSNAPAVTERIQSWRKALAAQGDAVAACQDDRVVPLPRPQEEIIHGQGEALQVQQVLASPTAVTLSPLASLKNHYPVENTMDAGELGYKGECIRLSPLGLPSRPGDREVNGNAKKCEFFDLDSLEIEAYTALYMSAVPRDVHIEAAIKQVPDFADIFEPSDIDLKPGVQAIPIHGCDVQLATQNGPANVSLQSPRVENNVATGLHKHGVAFSVFPEWDCQAAVLLDALGASVSLAGIVGGARPSLPVTRLDTG